MPELDSLLTCLEMSSATNEVVMLRRGILNNFDIMLKIDTETAAEANSTAPLKKKKVEELRAPRRPNRVIMKEELP